MSNQTAFIILFGEYEFTLKRRGFLQSGLDHAQADWNAFSRYLGQDFFEKVREAGIANTLIHTPPGKLMRELNWKRPDRPLATTQELLVQGVCRVRNSVAHGEKGRPGEAQSARNAALVAEAFAVLELARDELAVAEPVARAER